MFRSVSWSQFIETLIALLIIYYMAVLLIYYWADILKFFKQPLVLNKSTVGPLVSNEQLITDPEKENNNSLLRSGVHDLMEDLKIIFLEAAGDKIKKPQLLLKIQKKLKEYPQIKGTAFEKEINSQIEIQSSEQCEIILSTQELNMLWKG